jgi:hypothetical protein
MIFLMPVYGFWLNEPLVSRKIKSPAERCPLSAGFEVLLLILCDQSYAVVIPWLKGNPCARGPVFNTSI